MDRTELDRLYDTQLKPALAAFLDRTRARLDGLARQGMVLAPIGIIASWLLYQRFPDQNFVFLPGGLVFGYLLAGWLRLRQGYRVRFKREVIAPIVEAIDPSLRYDPLGAIGRDEFGGAALFDAGLDSFHGEDLVVGRFGGTTLRFSEVHARRHGRDGAERTRWRNVFRGFFIVADLPVTFAGSTTVLPDAAEPLLGHMAPTARAFLPPPGERVAIADPDFARLFTAWSDDPAEARHLLAGRLAPLLVRFRKRTGQTLCLCIRRSRAFIAIPSERDRFEPPELVAIEDVERLPRIERMLLDNLQAYLDDLRLGIDVARELGSGAQPHG